MTEHEKDMFYHGGPLDGQRVDLPGGMPAMEIEHDRHPDGRYVLNLELDRYEWKSVKRKRD